MQDNPAPDEVEYYYDDKHDPALRSRVIDDNYSENYDEKMRKAKANKTAADDDQKPPLGVTTATGVTPELRDYTLNDDFRDPFKSLPEVSGLPVPYGPCPCTPAVADACGGWGASVASVTLCMSVRVLSVL